MLLTTILLYSFILSLASSALVADSSMKLGLESMKKQSELVIKKLVNTAISDLENSKIGLIGKLAKLSEQVKDREDGFMNESLRGRSDTLIPKILTHPLN